MSTIEEGFIILRRILNAAALRYGPEGAHQFLKLLAAECCIKSLRGKAAVAFLRGELSKLEECNV